jgi:formylglycine-generating enzyme required for sulfatase activity
MAAAFTRIPGGWFLMGAADGREDERPVHRVWVDAFDLAVHPVTVAEYAEFAGATGHDLPPDWAAFAVAPDLPAVGVSWHDAQAYCAWRSGDASRCRLPTEAEWERAARGGLEGVRYPWGDEIPSWLPAAGRGSLARPWPVTLGPPNGYGVMGIAANVHEWCLDWYDARYYEASPARNPTGPPSGVRRASRGGSWRHAITISRCATRSRIDPSFRYTDYGFRVIRDSVPAPFPGIGEPVSRLAR